LLFLQEQIKGIIIIQSPKGGVILAKNSVHEFVQKSFSGEVKKSVIFPSFVFYFARELNSKTYTPPLSSSSAHPSAHLSAHTSLSAHPPRA
jgi:hypothetical protein